MLKSKIRNVTMRRAGVSYVPRRRARPRLNPGLRLPGASELVFSEERGDEDGSAVLNQFGGIFDDPNHTAEGRTHKQRREQEESNWQKVRPDLLRHVSPGESSGGACRTAEKSGNGYFETGSDAYLVLTCMWLPHGALIWKGGVSDQ